MAGCAQGPQQQLAANHHPKEYFPSSVYGRISPRVIADGQPIPHGGGQYLVGKPYTVAGQTYYPSERKIVQTGLASWYGDAFHGRLTANGEIYDRDGFTAAHPTMPLPSYARVTNLRNKYSMIVRVNDRGPYASNRIMDVSRRVAEALDFQRGGTANIKVEYVGRASLAGSDDAKLYATLRTNGPAHFDGFGEGVAVAAREPQEEHLASASIPLPQAARPERTVENERPKMLEAYRAPRSMVSESSPRIASKPMRMAAYSGSQAAPQRGRKPKAELSTWHEASIAPISRPAETRIMDRTIRQSRQESAVRIHAPSAAEARSFALRELQPSARPGRGAATFRTPVERFAPLPVAQLSPRGSAPSRARGVRLAAASPDWVTHRSGSAGRVRGMQGD